MTVNDIRKSELLEYYVLGLLSEDQLREVEGYLIEFPELRDDLIEIEGSMQAFAQKQGEAPKRDLRNDILENIRDKGSTTTTTTTTTSESTVSTKSNETSASSTAGIGKYLAMIFALSTLAAGYYAFTKYNDYQKLQSSYTALKNDCEEEKTTLREKIEIFDDLNNPKNRILAMTPTEGYQETDLIFYTNSVNRKNYIQIRNLPNIDDNQAFQLWSLKGGDSAPIPLTVFKDGDNYIVEVDFENGTGTYAITIEKEGGAESPTLSRLISTVNV